jgi:hypothetical protein
MKNSLQPTDFTTISSNNTTDNTFTINIDELKSDLINYNTMYGSDTIQSSTTIDTVVIPNNTNWVTLTTSQIAPLTTAQFGALDHNWISTNQFNPVVFKDSWPEWMKVQRMRKIYPSLERALTQLETVYNLIKDDYDSPVPKK